MLTIINRIVRLLPAALCFLLVACSKISQENFNKVQTGMTVAQVTSILGEPTTVESMDFAGISGTSATWKTKDTVITVQFLNDRAQIKTMNKIGNAPNAGSIPNSDNNH